MCQNSQLLTWMGYVFGYVVQFLYELFKNYGVAIIIFTIFTRIIMFPLSIKQQKTTAAQVRLQPKLEALRTKYGNDRDGLNQATQELYQKEGVSPAAGCLPTLIQLPIFMGMYEAIRRPLTCVLHLGAEKAQAICTALGLGLNPDGRKGNYYAEVEALKILRDLDLSGSGAGTAVLSAADVSSSSVVSASHIVASASDVVSNSGLVTSASDAAANIDIPALTALLGDNVDSIERMAKSFRFLGFDLLQTAGFWNLALILALLVFIAQIVSMMLSNKIMGVTKSQGGCSPNMMAIFMGAFSLMISFSVPAAFPLYWLSSSAIAPVQTWVTRKYFGPVVMNARFEAERNARLQIDEQKIIDRIVARKGSVKLQPVAPAEKVGGSGIQGGSASNRNNSGKKNKGKSKGSSSDYQGKKK